MTEHIIIERLHETLPAVFSRTEIEKLLPGIINSKTLANHSSAGTGPQSFRIGRKCVYERDSFLEWLSTRTRSVE